MKILILTSKFGMGHYSAAKSIEQKLCKNFSFDEIKLVDIFEHTYKEFCEVIYKSYSLLINKGASLYNLAYKKATKNTGENHTIALIRKNLYEHVSRLLQKERADLIISTYSVSSMLISEYKQKTKSDLPLITVITDINPHDTWVNPLTDWYLVADASTKEYLQAIGISPSKIRISGMPLGEDFEKKIGKSGFDRANHKMSNRMREENSATAVGTNPKKHLLIMGGGLGLIPKDLDFYQRINSIDSLHTTVVTGKNERLYRKLRNRFDNIEVLGFCHDICERMSRADILLTKSGGITTFEAICTQTPMVIFKPFLEQEIPNADFIKKENIGIVLQCGLENPRRAIRAIEELLADEDWRGQMKKNMKALSKRWDTDVIFDLIELQSISESA